MPAPEIIHHTFPQIITNRYNIKKQIGKGGMGHVYLAVDKQLMRNVAIKSIRPELLNNSDIIKRIDRECKMHAAIKSHPNIIGLYDRIDNQNNIFLIMEYVKGETVADIIRSANKSKTNIPIELIVTILYQCLDALACIHNNNVIHRDIKPSNIIVGGLDSENPYAKLMDFGIARNALEDDTATKITILDTSSGGPGTPAYMAPERIDASTFGNICPSTDLYSIGIILYELFQQCPPFHGTMTEIFSGHLTREPLLDETTHFPKEIKPIIKKALQKKTGDRYQAALDFAFDLRTVTEATDDETLLSTHSARTLSSTTPATPTPKHQVSFPLSRLHTAIILSISTLIIIGVYAAKQLPSKSLPQEETTLNNTQINSSTIVESQLEIHQEVKDTEEGIKQSVESDESTADKQHTKEPSLEVPPEEDEPQQPTLESSQSRSALAELEEKRNKEMEERSKQEKEQLKKSFNERKQYSSPAESQSPTSGGRRKVIPSYLN